MYFLIKVTHAEGCSVEHLHQGSLEHRSVEFCCMHHSMQVKGHFYLGHAKGAWLAHSGLQEGSEQGYGNVDPSVSLAMAPHT